MFGRCFALCVPRSPGRRAEARRPRPARPARVRGRHRTRTRSRPRRRTRGGPPRTSLPDEPLPHTLRWPSACPHLRFLGPDSGRVIGPFQPTERHVARLIHVPLLKLLAGRSPDWRRRARATLRLAAPFSRPQKYRADPGNSEPAVREGNRLQENRPEACYL